MEQRILPTKRKLAAAAAQHGAAKINAALDAKGSAAIILATGASQFEMLQSLVTQPVEWSKVRAFHLDEYIGIDDRHPASFRKYLKERFADRVTGLKEFNYIEADLRDPEEECARIGALIDDTEIDAAFIGIGENGHLAFNDPPADFETRRPYLVVTLDEACRRQQYGEGWFATLEDVPLTAISMSIRQIMKSRSLIVTVPDRRKAEAVRCAVKGDVTPDCPASILQRHSDCLLFLDEDSSSLL